MGLHETATADSTESTTLLAQLCELKSCRGVTETIRRKVENQLAAPTSPCLSTTHSLNSRESTRSLTPREGSPEESPLFEESEKDFSTAWQTDQEISATAVSKERELQPWEEPGGCDATLEELSSSKGDWDQFKVNADLFGYVSTFKEDLSQYTTAIDLGKVPLAARKRAERLAKEIELKGPRGAMEELGPADEEELFSAVPREDAKPLHTVSGSFFHVDGVGLVDENVVRSNPWMLKSQASQVLSTQETEASVLSTAPLPAPVKPAVSAPPAPAPVAPAPMQVHMQQQLHMEQMQAQQMEQMQLQQMEQMQMEQNYQMQMEQNYQYQMQMGMEMWSMFAPGTQVVVDGLVHAASFNGLSGWIESFDAETNRYNVQLPMMDASGAYQVAKILPENLMLDPRASYCQ
ncbi:unnamed protein product [Effrenium voratum]|uniref:LsmAD domain-containing protein n=1 Tax=Effrenium voratum TaxID=2562239 RepID=A0AA36HN11_9DINO|nr:unnamed protein product [Effrenium voratum]